ncbi:MAG: hypothetical protein KVP17_002437 [Porospora cf. gigantea B]|uniref:uncharacterized protein n=2 Tax=Porospora cf. gigantea B TaxID=2853592 RepID=UPI0035717B6C|nr:MAG: hypothetical protein KVP17_002437 [Porospora cf. gigantea B]
MLLLQMKRVSDCRAVVEHYLASNKNCLSGLLLLSYVDEADGELIDAMDHCYSLLKLEPHWPPAVKRIADLESRCIIPPTHLYWRILALNPMPRDLYQPMDHLTDQPRLQPLYDEKHRRLDDEPHIVTTMEPSPPFLMVVCEQTEPGDLLASITPVACAMDPMHMPETMCFHCLQPTADVQHVSCAVNPDSCPFHYCSQACMLENAHVHDVECGIVANGLYSISHEVHLDPEMLLLILRVLFRFRHQKLLQSAVSLEFQETLKLVHMTELVRARMPELFEDLKRLGELFEQMLGPENLAFMSSAELLRVLVAVHQNAVTVDLDSGQAGHTAYGLFYSPLVAEYHHSCRPTAHISFGPVLALRAARVLFRGDPISIDYNRRVMQPLVSRKHGRASARVLFCKCDRCITATDDQLFLNGLSCVRCVRGWACPSLPAATRALLVMADKEPEESEEPAWFCNVCGVIRNRTAAVEFTRRQRLIEKAYQDGLDLRESQRTMELRKVWKAFLDQASHYYHPNHHLLFRIHLHLAGLHLREPQRDPLRALTCLRKATVVAGRCLPPFTATSAGLHLLLAQVTLECKALSASRDYLVAKDAKQQALTLAITASWEFRVSQGPGCPSWMQAMRVLRRVAVHVGACTPPTRLSAAQQSRELALSALRRVYEDPSLPPDAVKQWLKYDIYRPLYLCAVGGKLREFNILTEGLPQEAYHELKHLGTGMTLLMAAASHGHVRLTAEILRRMHPLSILATTETGLSVVHLLVQLPLEDLGDCAHCSLGMRCVKHAQRPTLLHFLPQVDDLLTHDETPEPLPGRWSNKLLSRYTGIYERQIRALSRILACVAQFDTSCGSDKPPETRLLARANEAWLEKEVSSEEDRNLRRPSLLIGVTLPSGLDPKDPTAPADNVDVSYIQYRNEVSEMQQRRHESLHMPERRWVRIETESSSGSTRQVEPTGAQLRRLSQKKSTTKATVTFGGSTVLIDPQKRGKRANVPIKSVFERRQLGARPRFGREPAVHAAPVEDMEDENDYEYDEDDYEYEEGDYEYDEDDYEYEEGDYEYEEGDYEYEEGDYEYEEGEDRMIDGLKKRTRGVDSVKLYNFQRPRGADEVPAESRRRVARRRARRQRRREANLAARGGLPYLEGEQRRPAPDAGGEADLPTTRAMNSLLSRKTHPSIGHNTPVHLAALSGKTEMLKLLLHYNAPASELNANNELPLHLAVQGGQPEAVRELLAHSSGLDLRDCRGRTPLHLAAFHLNALPVSLLLFHGADPGALTLAGGSVYHVMCDGLVDVTPLVTRTGLEPSHPLGGAAFSELLRPRRDLEPKIILRRLERARDTMHVLLERSPKSVLRVTNQEGRIPCEYVVDCLHRLLSSRIPGRQAENEGWKKVETGFHQLSFMLQPMALPVRSASPEAVTVAPSPPPVPTTLESAPITPRSGIRSHKGKRRRRTASRHFIRLARTQDRLVSVSDTDSYTPGAVQSVMVPGLFGEETERQDLKPVSDRVNVDTQLLFDPEQTVEAKTDQTVLLFDPTSKDTVVLLESDKGETNESYVYGYMSRDLVEEYNARDKEHDSIVFEITPVQKGEPRQSN